MNIFIANIEELQKDEYRYLEKHVGIEHKDYKIVDCDFIVSLDKSSLQKATYLSQIHNTPVLAYIDWINPWDVFLDDETNWGFFQKLKYKDKVQAFQQIAHELRLFSKVDMPVVSTEYTRNLIQTIINEPVNCSYLKRGFSFKKAYGVRNENPGTKFITIYSGLTKPEKTYHILRALSMIKDVITLPIILLSDTKDLTLQTISEAFGVPIQVVATKNKNNVLNNSKVVISLNNKENISEALYFNNRVVTYRTPYIEEYFGTSPVYAEDNSTWDLSEKIKSVLTDLENQKTNTIRNIPSMETFINGLLKLCRQYNKRPIEV